MAQVRRIGGGSLARKSAVPPRSVWAGLLLYLLPLPLIPASIMSLFVGHPGKAVARAVAFALIMLSAWLIRRGVQLEVESRTRRWRRRSSQTPYRLIGASVLALALFVLVWLGFGSTRMFQTGPLVALLYAAAGFAGCWLYYGFDPSARSGDIATVGITTEELIELLDEADGRIASIEDAASRIGNVELRDRLRRIGAEARKVVDAIEDDPTDARRARKFLKVYLDGAQQVTEGYARMHGLGDESGAAALEDNFRRVLTTIETVIAEQQQKLRENNVTDLDVQIEVLQMQLEKEGVS